MHPSEKDSRTQTQKIMKNFTDGKITGTCNKPLQWKLIAGDMNSDIINRHDNPTLEFKDFIYHKLGMRPLNSCPKELTFYRLHTANTTSDPSLLGKIRQSSTIDYILTTPNIATLRRHTHYTYHCTRSLHGKNRTN